MKEHMTKLAIHSNVETHEMAAIRKKKIRYKCSEEELNFQL